MLTLHAWALVGVLHHKVIQVNGVTHMSDLRVLQHNNKSCRIKRGLTQERAGMGVGRMRGTGRGVRAPGNWLMQGLPDVV